jgi:hypothetical protein
VYAIQILEKSSVAKERGSIQASPLLSFVSLLFPSQIIFNIGGTYKWRNNNPVISLAEEFAG